MHLPHDSFKEGAGDTRQECVCVCAHQHLDCCAAGWLVGSCCQLVTIKHSDYMPAKNNFELKFDLEDNSMSSTQM